MEVLDRDIGTVFNVKATTTNNQILIFRSVDSGFDDKDVFDFGLKSWVCRCTSLSLSCVRPCLH